jgi:hypothetical protein
MSFWHSDLTKLNSSDAESDILMSDSECEGTAKNDTRSIIINSRFSEGRIIHLFMEFQVVVPVAAVCEREIN